MPLSRYFRFRLRTLLVATALVAAGCWLVPQWRLVQARKAAILQLGHCAHVSPEERHKLPFIRRLLGDQYVTGIHGKCVFKGQQRMLWIDGDYADWANLDLFPEALVIFR